MSFIHYILQWFYQNKRSLPWRNSRDPYKIWISEIILQQTRIAQGLHYFTRFISHFPDIDSLAKASEQDVLRLWQGLGYYSRARNLHKASKIIKEKYNGVFPDNFDELKKLPGIGPYTAAAISSICFKEAVPAIDGNAYRVYSRFFGIEDNIASGKSFKIFFDLGKSIIPKNEPGDFNEAIMELGATVCLPQKPICDICPLDTKCFALIYDKVQKLPVNKKEIKIANKSIDYFFIYFGNSFLIKHRNKKGIWKNMYDFPENNPSQFNLKPKLSYRVKHILTHQKIIISFYEIDAKKDFYNLAEVLGCEIVDSSSINKFPLPKPIENFIANRFN